MNANSTHVSETWHVPTYLTSSAIDEWVESLSPTTQSVTVRLGRWKTTGPFADARLQSALCLLHRRNIETKADVPPITLTGKRANDAFEPPDIRLGVEPLTPTERNLACSVAGLTVGQLCQFDRAHIHIPVHQRTWLTRRKHVFGWGDEFALVVPTGVGLVEVPKKPANSRESEFHNRLLTLLESVGLCTRDHKTTVDRIFGSLKTFSFEAVENTGDHGRLDFDNNPIRSIRFAKLRRIGPGAHGFDSHSQTTECETPYQTYLRSLLEAKDLSPRWTLRSGRLLELTVADGGVGMAARMARGFHVFEAPFEKEIAYVLQALLPNATTKSHSQAGRGQGLSKMLQACYNLSGLLILRTGRLRASRTFRKIDGSKEVVDFKDEKSSAYSLNVEKSPLSLVAGTSISLVFPV